MSKTQKPKPANSLPVRERSFTVALAQMAQLLRSEVKLRERASYPQSTSPLDKAIKQIAKLLRSQIEQDRGSRPRKWNSSPEQS